MNTNHHTIPGELETEHFLNVPYKNRPNYEEDLSKLLLEKTKKTVGYKRKEISPLDFTNLNEITNKYAEETIVTQIKKLPNAENLYNNEKKELTTEGLEYLSNLLNETIQYYTETFVMPVLPSYINNRNGGKKGEIKFQNHQQFIQFFTYNNNKKNIPYNRKTHCSLLKILFCKNDLNIHQSQLQNTQEIFEEIKQENIYPYFKDIKGNTVDEKQHADENYMQLRTSSNVSNKEQIYFFASGRTKSYNRSLLKMLGNSEYTTSDAIKDLYGFRCEVKTQKDALLLLEYFQLYIGQHQGKIKHKNIFGKTTEDIQEFVEDNVLSLDKEFLKDAENIRGTDNTGKSSGEFKDVKISLPFKDSKGKTHRVEVQIVLVNNQNETGYSHHKIYELMNTIEALTRLQGFAPAKLIKRYIERTIQTNIQEAKEDNENSELLYVGGLSNKENYWKLDPKKQEAIITKAEKNIFEHIKKHQLRELIFSKKGNSEKKEIYTTIAQWNKFHEDEKHEVLYPKGASIIHAGGIK